MWMQKQSLPVTACLIWILLSSCTALAATRDTLPTSTALPPTPVPSKVSLFRGNPQRTGVYDLPAIRKEPEIKWQTQVSSAWLMPPLLADDILYTGSGDGVLYALYAETGEELWSVDGFEGLESTGAVAGDLIVTAGYNMLVKAMDRATGDERWTFQADYPVQGAPLIVDKRVIIATDHWVYALDLESGHLAWDVATGIEGGYMGAPAYDDGVIYTTGG
jgi:serine/threonine-protein kinase